MFKFPLVPATNTVLCMYAAYLACFLLPQSVCVYINFVGLLHREMGFANPLTDNWVVSSLLTGMRRVLGVPVQSRLPITVQLLMRIRTRLNLNSSRHASFWAICLTAFFGLFRKCHLLPVSGPKFNPMQQFTRSDFVSFAKGYLVHVRWSKTIQLHQRIVTIPLLSVPHSPLCPVTAIQHAFSLTVGAASGSQAFCWRHSTSAKLSVFTYKAFMSYMKQILAELGLPTHRYGTHSFRRGGATFALEAGVSLDVISLLGDWKSDAMFLYLHLPLTKRISAQEVIASQLPLF